MVRDADLAHALHWPAGGAPAPAPPAATLTPSARTHGSLPSLVWSRPFAQSAQHRATNHGTELVSSPGSIRECSRPRRRHNGRPSVVLLLNMLPIQPGVLPIGLRPAISRPLAARIA